MRTLLVVALMWPGLALAGRPLTYEEVLEAAARASPGVRSAELTATQAQADVKAAKGQFDPNFTLGSGWNRGLSRERFGQFPDPFNLTSDAWNLDLSLSGTAPTGTSASFDAGMSASTVLVDVEGVDNPLSELFGGEQQNYRPTFRLTLSQELLRGIRLAFNLQGVRRANLGLSVAELDLTRAGQQAVADAARAYWNWVYLAKVAEISKQSVVIAEENLRIGVARVEGGQAAPLERTRLEAAVVQARTTALEADNTAAQAADALLLLMGERPGQALEPASDPGDAPAVQLEPEEAVMVALEHSPAMLAQRQRLEDARMGLVASRHGTWPTLTATVTGALQGFDDQSLGGAYVLYETMFPSVGVSGTLRVPLGNRAAVGGAQRAAAEVQRQQQLLADLDAQTRANVDQQVRLLVSSSRRVELADSNVRLARETLAAEEALYGVGRTLLKDVLESRTELERAQVEAIKARTDFRTAEVELQRLQGQL